jgi:hypothetical protein
LELATSHHELRDSAIAVSGNLGGWLAQQNGRWQWAITVEPHEAVWHTGATDERKRTLASIRKRDPVSARDLLATTWQSEKAEDRKLFLTVLSENLSREDEAFLEGALDDRSVIVRRAAAGLLGELPESAYRARITGYAKDLLQLVPKGLLRQKAIEVNLPDLCTAEMERDGVEPKPPKGVAMGERQWWTLMLLSRTPLSFWTKRWNTNPETLVAAAGRGDYNDLLLDGWAAAARSGDVEWADALLRVRARDDESQEQLFRILSPALRERHLSPQLDGRLDAAIRYAPDSWSRDFTERFLSACRKQISGATPWQISAMGPMLRTAATFAHLDTRLDVEMHDPLAEFAATLAFRRLMHEAILETN